MLVIHVLGRVNGLWTKPGPGRGQQAAAPRAPSRIHPLRRVYWRCFFRRSAPQGIS